MNYDIVHVEPRENYRLFIRFADGLSGEADVSHVVGKGIFKAWKKPDFFAKVFVDAESRTACWPGGIDVAPDTLYERVAASHKRKRKAA